MQEDKIKSVKVQQLKIDRSLVELRPINIFYVSRYRQAYRTEANMPMIIIDTNTMMITSGNHRARALGDEYEPNHKIKVICRHYADRRAVLEDFTRENASHGNALDGISRSRITNALLEEGATAEEIAILFNVPTQRIEIWGNKTAVVSERVGRKLIRKIRPIKRGVNIVKPITKRQYDHHIKADTGVEFCKMVGECIRKLDNDWVERTPESYTLVKELIAHSEAFISSFEEVEETG